uniref:dynein axonemal intermediate chain 3 n=1 Tax=Myxine glutinosa TaxID=7769 RepID=UPI00358F9868
MPNLYSTDIPILHVVSEMVVDRTMPRVFMIRASSRQVACCSISATIVATYFPIFLTTKTQELFHCCVEEDVSAENPLKVLHKDDIISDMKTRAAVSDFHPAKQIILDYPDDELLLVYDNNFQHGQNFFLVTTQEAKDKLLNPHQEETGLEKQDVEVYDEEELAPFEYHTPEPQPWSSLGSEMEIEDERQMVSQQKLVFRATRALKLFGKAVSFSDLDPADPRAGVVDCAPFEDTTHTLSRLELDCAVQACPVLNDNCSQTSWRCSRNAHTQYSPRILTDTERTTIQKSQEFIEFLTSVTPRMVLALQQNDIVDVFSDEWVALPGKEELVERCSDDHLKEIRSFVDPTFSEDEGIACVHWHPTLQDVVVLSIMELLPLNEQVKLATQPGPSRLLVWHFSDPTQPKVVLEAPDGIFCFEFCPSDQNLIAGGCRNGQILLWDITSHTQRLLKQETEKLDDSAAAMETEVKEEFKPPSEKHCAASAIESGHRMPVTDIHWLPGYFELSCYGVPLENKTKLCLQLLSCSVDGAILFWDIRSAKSAELTKRRRLTDKGGVKTRPVKYLDLKWQPLFKVSVPSLSGSSVCSLTCLSLHIDADKTSHAKEARKFLDNVDYADLQQTPLHNVKILDDIVTNIFLGTKDGEVVHTNWRLQKESGGKFTNSKPHFVIPTHKGSIVTMERSPFCCDLLLCVGGDSFSLWKDGVQNGALQVSRCETHLYTSGCWSPSRPAIFFLGRADGMLEVWDLLEETLAPIKFHNVTSSTVTSIRAQSGGGGCHGDGGDDADAEDDADYDAKDQLLAISDSLGTLHILQLPRELSDTGTQELMDVQQCVQWKVKRMEYLQKCYKCKDALHKVVKEQQEDEEEHQSQCEGVLDLQQQLPQMDFCEQKD